MSPRTEGVLTGGRELSSSVEMSPRAAFAVAAKVGREGSREGLLPGPNMAVPVPMHTPRSGSWSGQRLYSLGGFQGTTLSTYSIPTLTLVPTLYPLSTYSIPPTVLLLPSPTAYTDLILSRYCHTTPSQARSSARSRPSSRT